MPIATWVTGLEARPHWATAGNTLLLSLFLAMVQDPALTRIAGGGALGLATAFFLIRALGRTFSLRGEGYPYRLALNWIPGLLAAGLGYVGLRLVLAFPTVGLAHGGGAALLALETALLVLVAADLAQAPPEGGCGEVAA